MTTSNKFENEKDFDSSITGIIIILDEILLVITPIFACFLFCKYNNYINTDKFLSVTNVSTSGTYLPLGLLVFLSKSLNLFYFQEKTILFLVSVGFILVCFCEKIISHPPKFDQITNNEIEMQALNVDISIFEQHSKNREEASLSSKILKQNPKAKYFTKIRFCANKLKKIEKEKEKHTYKLGTKINKEVFDETYLSDDDTNKPEIINLCNSSTVHYFSQFLLISVHSIFEGLALGAITKGKNFLCFCSIVILLRKCHGIIRLDVYLQSSKIEREIRITLIVLFSLVIPLSMGVSNFIVLFLLKSTNQIKAIQCILWSLSCGSCLFISTYEILNDEFSINFYKKAKISAFLICLCSICIIPYIVKI